MASGAGHGTCFRPIWIETADLLTAVVAGRVGQADVVVVIRQLLQGGIPGGSDAVLVSRGEAPDPLQRRQFVIDMVISSRRGFHPAGRVPGRKGTSFALCPSEVRAGVRKSTRAVLPPHRRSPAPPYAEPGVVTDHEPASDLRGSRYLVTAGAGQSPRGFELNEEAMWARGRPGAPGWTAGAAPGCSGVPVVRPSLSLIPTVPR